jgi:hypothetical protein
MRQDAKQVERRAPGKNLRGAERRDDDAAVGAYNMQRSRLFA